MDTKSEASQKGCPFALSKDIEKMFVNHNNGDGDVGTGNFVDMSASNRTQGGQYKGDCLCLTDGCTWWMANTADKGYCTKLDDNRQTVNNPDTGSMKGKWCPVAIVSIREQSQVGDTGGFNGFDIALAGVNREGGGAHPSCMCVTTSCMAYKASAQDRGTCMLADKNMNTR